jgi:hypothetical protein
MRFCSAVAFMLVACHGQPTSPSGDLEVSTSVAPSVFRVGQTVTVTVVVTNRADQSRTIETNVCEPFHVMTAGGTVVGPAARFCTASSLQKTLVPGEQFVFTTTWSGEARGAGPTSPAAFLAPGTYVVHGLAYLSTFKSAPVTIQVIP